MAYGISVADPGAVPGASTKFTAACRIERSGGPWGRNRFDARGKGNAFARHDTAVIGSKT